MFVRVYALCYVSMCLMRTLLYKYAFFARMRDRACAHIVAHMYVLREFEEFARDV